MLKVNKLRITNYIVSPFTTKSSLHNFFKQLLLLNFSDMAVTVSPMCCLSDLDLWHSKVRVFWWTNYDPICVNDLDLYKCGELTDFQIWGNN